MEKVMPIEDGGSAFPATEANYHNENMRGEGMSLRDYFAAKALQGLASNPSFLDNTDSRAVQYTAEGAYQLADAMLSARS
ncbi:hypothetical protein HZF02_17030 [Pseudomonas yamanorum]|nr:hypothetical protein HZF02_17030 [Pseudomonas yamanorum]